MIVADASVAVDALTIDGPARAILSAEQVHVPHLIDSEVASVLRRQVRQGAITSADGLRSLDVWARLGLVRHPAQSLLSRIWELRDNLSAYDATYVALAEHLACSLVTTDRRLAAAPGIVCPVTVLDGR